MSDLKLIGQYPTSYGVKVDVFRHPDDPNDGVFDLDAAMTMAGVYGVADRQKCKAALVADMNTRDNRSTRAEVFWAHGGHPNPKEILTRPEKPAFKAIPAAPMDLPIDAWVTTAMDQAYWSDRAPVLIDIIHSNIEQQRDWAVPKEIKALALSIMLTATLEHLMEDEIDCLEAAALYALTIHPQWSAAGVSWLKPFRRTWFRDWAVARPQYQEVARLLRHSGNNQPVWLVKGTSS